MNLIMPRKRNKILTTEVVETYRCVQCDEKWSRSYCKLKGHQYNKDNMPVVPIVCWYCGGDMKLFKRVKNRN